jgi:hypothetical protein
MLRGVYPERVEELSRTLKWRHIYKKREPIKALFNEQGEEAVDISVTGRRSRKKQLDISA